MFGVMPKKGLSDEAAIEQGLKRKPLNSKRRAKSIRKRDAHFHEYGFERERPDR
jgi:hypothetical protein